MTPAEFATIVRFKTRTNSTTFTDAQILALQKERQREIAQEIVKADEDILLVPQYTSLVADQREYPYPTDMLSRIKRLEGKLNGTDWVKLNEMDLPDDQKPVATEANITSRYSNLEGEAFFDIKRRSVFLYTGTIIAVTSGLRLWVNTWPTAITGLTEAVQDMSTDPSVTTHGIPTELHKVWATGVVIDWKSS